VASFQVQALIILLVLLAASAWAILRMHVLGGGRELWARMRGRRARFLIYLSALGTAGGLGLLGMIWTVTEDVPDGGLVDAPLDAEIDPLGVTFPAQGPEPELVLRDLAGKRALFFVDNFQSQAEGTKLRRAINRWVLPEDVVVINVGDAPQVPSVALGMMEDKFLKYIRKEAKTPIYVDTAGALVDTYKLPRGHMGLLILGPDGAIELRHSGDADAARIEEIRTLIGAEEPPPPPPAPEFEHEGWNKARCAELPCVFVFLDQPVDRSDIPRIEGGYEGDDAFERAMQPGIRLAGLAAGDWKITGDKAQGLLIGKLTGITPEGWELTEQAPSLREAFHVAPDEAALIVVDAEGRLAFDKHGLVRFWEFGQAGEVLGLEARDVEMDEE
jgi:hypothetical protein